MKVWLQNNLVKVIDIPSHSPELNIAENLFADLEPRVEKHNSTTAEQLKNAILEEWKLTNPDLLKAMSKSMVSRCIEIQKSPLLKINH
jgi:glutamate synthase domain-containing protein 3